MLGKLKHQSWFSNPITKLQKLHLCIELQGERQLTRGECAQLVRCNNNALKCTAAMNLNQACIGKRSRCGIMHRAARFPDWILVNPFIAQSPILLSSAFHHFYRTRVRSLAMLVTHSLTDWLTHSLPFSKLDWCDPGVWRRQPKTYWWCNCFWLGSCWQQFVSKVRFGQKA